MSLKLFCKGKRIGRWDDRLILRSVIFSFIVPTAVTIVFCFWKYGMDEIRKANWLLVGIIVFCVGITFSLWCVCRDDLYNRQSLARLLLENGWYETEPLHYGKKGGRIRITYFPAIYYKRKGCYLHVMVKVTMGKYQKQLLSLEEKLESGLDCELIKKDTRGVWLHYEFLTNVEKNRLPLKQIEVKEGSIPLMKHISWNYDLMPHMLVSGGTGSGKTCYLLILIERLLCTDAELYIIDPKHVDLSYLSQIMPEVWSETKDILNCIERFNDQMELRYEEMNHHPDYKMGMNYAALHMPAHFLIFDEYVAFMEMLEKKEREYVVSLIKKIVLKGRQAGFFLVLACQRPDAKYLGDGIRDQFGFRLALGNMSDSGYTMMFGNIDKVYRKKEVQGRGYVNTGGDVVTEFYAPYIEKDHDFYGEIELLYQKRQSVATSQFEQEEVQIDIVETETENSESEPGIEETEQQVEDAEQEQTC